MIARSWPSCSPADFGGTKRPIRSAVNHPGRHRSRNLTAPGAAAIVVRKECLQFPARWAACTTPDASLSTSCRTTMAAGAQACTPGPRREPGPTRSQAARPHPSHPRRRFNRSSSSSSASPPGPATATPSSPKPRASAKAAFASAPALHPALRRLLESGWIGRIEESDAPATAPTGASQNSAELSRRPGSRSSK